MHRCEISSETDYNFLVMYNITVRSIVFNFGTIKDQKIST